VYKKGKTVYATTEDLASLSSLNTNAVQEIYLLSGELLSHLCTVSSTVLFLTAPASLLTSTTVTGHILEDLVAVLRNYIGVLLKMAE
jgi:hypothetical protein